MRKWLLYLLLPLPLLLNSAEAAPVLTQWGQDPSGTNRNVFVLNPTDFNWVSIGTFNTGTDTFTVGAANIPLPTASTLGGVFSSSAPANQFATGIDLTGHETYAQPSFANLNGSISGTQIPSNTITNAMLQSGVAVANLGSAAQNFVFATPVGASGTGSFRALIANDIPGTLNATTFLGLATDAPASGQAAFVANAVATQQASIYFQDATVSKWQLGKQTDDSFFIFDGANSINFLTVTTGGNITIGERVSNSNTFIGSIQSLPVLTTNPSSFWQFNMSESWAGGAGFGTPFYINDVMGNGGTGQRQVLTVNFASGYGGNGFNYVGAQFQATSCGTKNTGDCAGLGGGLSGHYFPISTVATAYTNVGATGTDIELANEFDVEAETGSGSGPGIARKVGLQIISVNADAVHATNATLDDGLLIDGGSGVGFTNAIYIASCVAGCGNVLSTSGTIMAAGGITVANGIDFSLTTFTGKAFKSNGFTVDNNGAIVGNGKASFGTGALAGVALSLQNSAGTCTHTPAAGSETVSCSSDRRLKYDIYSSQTSALDLIDTFHIDQFRLNADNSFHPFGVIAQEVEEKHPHMVHQNGEYLTVDQPDPWMLVKAIQELQSEIRGR